MAVAQDTGGTEVAAPFYEAAKATYTTLVDETHLVSALYDMSNVPTGVMIDEEGRIVRWDEGTYTRTYSAGDLTFGTDEYVPMLRDWVQKGPRSEFVFDRGAMAERLKPRDDRAAKAAAHFRLAVHFQLGGDVERADRHWREAQELDPLNWNYHRQDWSFTPDEAGRNWLEKFRSLGDHPYYRPMELPPGEQ